MLTSLFFAGLKGWEAIETIHLGIAGALVVGQVDYTTRTKTGGAKFLRPASDDRKVRERRWLKARERQRQPAKPSRGGTSLALFLLLGNAGNANCGFATRTFQIRTGIRAGQDECHERASWSIFAARMKSLSVKPSILCVQVLISTISHVR